MIERRNGRRAIDEGITVLSKTICHARELGNGAGQTWL
jgi:hypothetical protein